MKRSKAVLVGLLIMAIGLSIVSCASMPGAVTVSSSSYDGGKQVRMEPGWANAGLGLGATLKIGVWKTSTMASDEAMLIVRNDQIKNFAMKHPNFFVKIDGVETALSPTKVTTDFSVGSETDVAHGSQDYPIKLETIRKMVQSPDVRFRLLLEEGIVEGDLSKGGPTTARKGLSEFLEKVAQLK